MSKKNLYKACCDEIVSISELFPGWCISRFIDDENIDVSDANLFLSSLKEYKSRLELDNHVITTDEEVEEIMRNNTLITKKLIYGED